MKGIADTFSVLSSHFSLFTNHVQRQIPATLCMRDLLAAESIWPRSRAGQARPEELGCRGPLERPSTIDCQTDRLALEDYLSSILAFRCNNPEACSAWPLRGPRGDEPWCPAAVACSVMYLSWLPPLPCLNATIPE